MVDAAPVAIEEAPERETDVLIVGAGPFGLALAAHVKALGIDHVLLGRQMRFWTEHMPQGMFLRSSYDWHLDTQGIHTIEVFAYLQGRTPKEAEPLSLRFYLDYVDWFVRQKGLAPDPTYVERLDRLHGPELTFRAVLKDGRAIRARRVVLALGFGHFEHVPADLVARLPAGRFAHTCDFVDFAGVAGRQLLIIGGRQSAFEWAALLREAGAAAVHVVHRDPSPAFTTSDWSWVTPLVDAMVDDPGWFRRLPQSGKVEVSKRLWAEGRLKAEPWLERRVLRDGVSLWPDANIASAEVLPDGAISARLDVGATLLVDQIVLATGYKPDVAKVPLLARGNLLGALPVRDGCPVLDEGFQTGVPGLFMTSMVAMPDFGPFFAFTVSVRTSAQVIGRALRGPAAATPADVAALAPAATQ